MIAIRAARGPACSNAECISGQYDVLGSKRPVCCSSALADSYLFGVSDLESMVLWA